MDIAIPLYDRVTALDAIGPYEVLSRLPGARVRFVAMEAGLYKTDTRQLTLVAEDSVADVPRPEVIVVPGGTGTRDGSAAGLADWVRAAHPSTRWTTSVCTGALILGEAGVLDGLRATTHWLYHDRLRELGAEPTLQRVVEDGKVVTAAGVSAGIDMALTLAERIAGAEAAQLIQLAIEYDPQPPHDAGSPEKAPPEIVERLRSLAASAGEI